MSDPSADVAHLESDPHTIAHGTVVTVHKTDDPVNHPSQYTQGEIECIDAIDSAVTALPPDEAVCVANVIKYVWRYRRKSPVESLKKAGWYLDRLIGKMEKRYAECLPTKGEPIHVDVQHRV